MKIIEKISLTIFSILILIISIVNCLLIFGWLDISVVNSVIKTILNEPTYNNILLIVSVLFILLSIKCIFFNSSNKENTKNGSGILLENDNGKLVVSKETLINIVNGVANGFESTQNTSARVILDKDNNLKIYVELLVKPNAIIKDLSINLQNRIKEAIKKTADLDVKEVNIKIKNIASENK